MLCAGVGTNLGAHLRAGPWATVWPDSRISCLPCGHAGSFTPLRYFYKSLVYPWEHPGKAGCLQPQLHQFRLQLKEVVRDPLAPSRAVVIPVSLVPLHTDCLPHGELVRGGLVNVMLCPCCRGQQQEVPAGAGALGTLWEFRMGLFCRWRGTTM